MDRKKGQATVESVLLMVVLLSLATIVLKDGMYAGAWMKRLVGMPGYYIKGMSIAGAWKECQNPPSVGSSGSCSAMEGHPNQYAKHTQVKGDNSQ